MIGVRFDHKALNILCLGAHCDDIEIGCGGTILNMLAERPETKVHWVVLSSTPQRKEEAVAAAQVFLKDGGVRKVSISSFRDGFLPYLGSDVKDLFEELGKEISPDLIFTHYRNDRHQDHRLVSDLTWNTFRNHCILEYEIPKYDGDLGVPNFFVPLGDALCHEKVDNILHLFPSQGGKPWFTSNTFLALARLRGMEAGGGTEFAEAFYSRKLVYEHGRPCFNAENLARMS